MKSRVELEPETAVVMTSVFEGRTIPSVVPTSYVAKPVFGIGVPAGVCARAANGRARTAASRISAHTSRNRLRRDTPAAAGSLRHNVRTAVARSGEPVPILLRTQRSLVAQVARPARERTCRRARRGGLTVGSGAG